MSKKLWKNKLGLADNLRRTLPELARKYFTAGRDAMQEKRTWEDMHEFRLLTKRFRYTLEIFREFYGPGLEARIDQLRKMQNHLGEINDLIVTGQMLAEVASTAEVRDRFQAEAGKKTAKVRKYWERTFALPEVEGAWTAYLERYACRRPPQRATGPGQRAASGA